VNDYLRSPHPDPFVERCRPYITLVVAALVRHNFEVVDSWLDPRDPRDATIRLTLHTDRHPGPTDKALVWDEETGWRLGGFVSGRQGVRTILSQATALGGGLLPTGDDLARRIVDGATALPHRYRSHLSTQDGFEQALWMAGTQTLILT
jgi:hypothetical protein